MKKKRSCFTWRTQALAYVSTIGLVAAAPLSAFAADSSNTNDNAALFGQYLLVNGEKDGQKIPDERIAGSTAKITANTITTYDKDKKETYAVTYKLDTSKDPWRITMTSTRAPVTAEVAEGLIKKEGDTVRLIYGVRGGVIPDDFTTDDKQLMFIMKKADTQAQAASSKEDSSTPLSLDE